MSAGAPRPDLDDAEREKPSPGVVQQAASVISQFYPATASGDGDGPDPITVAKALAATGLLMEEAP